MMARYHQQAISPPYRRCHGRYQPAGIHHGRMLYAALLVSARYAPGGIEDLNGSTQHGSSPQPSSKTRCIPRRGHRYRAFSLTLHVALTGQLEDLVASAPLVCVRWCVGHRDGKLILMTGNARHGARGSFGMVSPRCVGGGKPAAMHAAALHMRAMYHLHAGFSMEKYVTEEKRTTPASILAGRSHHCISRITQELM